MQCQFNENKECNECDEHKIVCKNCDFVDSEEYCNHPYSKHYGENVVGYTMCCEFFKEKEQIEEEIKLCACCGKEIEEGESYFKCLENFLLVKFFDSEEDNIFCSKKCFCEQLFLEEIDL